MKNTFIDKKSYKFCIILFFCFVMIFSSLIGVSAKTNETEEVSLETTNYIELKGNQLLRQEFEIQKNLGIITDKIGIAVKKEKEITGYLQVKLIQKDKVLQIEKIAFPNMVSETYYDLEIDTEKLAKGTAQIELEYISFCPEDIVFIMAGTGQLSLNTAWLDGKPLNNSLALKLTYQISELSEIAQVIARFMKILLPVLLILAVYFFVYTKKNRIMRLCLTSAIFLTISLRYYPLILNCQPFAEELNVYIDSAVNENFIRSLLIKDAG